MEWVVSQCQPELAFDVRLFRPHNEYGHHMLLYNNLLAKCFIQKLSNTLMILIFMHIETCIARYYIFSQWLSGSRSKQFLLPILWYVRWGKFAAN